MSLAEPASRPSEARERLLDTATKIFYATGIHSVGVDRIIAEANVTRSTFYRHFPAKEDLVVAYLDRIHQYHRAQVDQVLTSSKPSADVLRSIAHGIARELQRPGFRGCAFINAAAEYPDPDHPVRTAVFAHREWFQTTITGLFATSGNTSSEDAGRHYVMLRDGAKTAGCLGYPELTGETFLRGVEQLLDRES